VGGDGGALFPGPDVCPLIFFLPSPGSVSRILQLPPEKVQERHDASSAQRAQHSSASAAFFVPRMCSLPVEYAMLTS